MVLENVTASGTSVLSHRSDFLPCAQIVSAPLGYDVQDEHTLALVVKMVSKSPTCKGHLDCVGHNQLATRVVREGGHASIQYCGVRLQL